MKGTGTKEDMFIPESWDDFVTALGTTDAYVSVPEGTVYDAGAIKPEGFADSPIMLTCRYLDMHGSSIINAKKLVLRRPNPGGGTSDNPTRIDIHNMKIEHFDNEGQILLDKTDETYDHVYFHDCMFEGIVTYEWGFCGGSYRNSQMFMYRCALIIEKTGAPSSSTYPNDTRIPITYDCHISIRIAHSWDLYYVQIATRTFNTLIELLGDIKEPSRAVTSLIYGEYTASGPFIIKVPSINRVYYKTEAGSSTGQNDNPYCTMEQASDPAFMYQLGFPIPYAEVTK